MIVVNLRGGLGNQFFQIFAGLSFSINTNQNFKIFYYNQCFFSNDEKTTRRDLYWENIFYNLKDNLLDANYSIDKTKLYKEKGFSFKEIQIIKKEIILDGYFQSYKYFNNNFDIICKKLELFEKRDYVKNKYNFDFKNLCSIHFRLGDYKFKKDYHLNLPLTYYLDAINTIIHQNGKKSFLIFFEKEDITSINNITQIFTQKINKINQILLIDTNIPDYEQLLIMSNCHSHIIANSSFSWWGAYLNPNKNKIVIRPSQWFGPKMNHNNITDLCPNDWKIIYI